MTWRVFVSERGNVFMREIAEHLVEGLVAQGRPAELVTDELPGDGDPARQLVVAPHEFFPLFAAAEADRLRAAGRAVCINTEQPATPFFATALAYAELGPFTLDINRFSLDALRRRGVTAAHLPLGYVASMDQWRNQPHANRSIDIGLLAGRTPRREQFIGGAAGQLWEWRTDLRFFSWHRPRRASDATFFTGDAKYQRLADTRILLNVHRDDEPYFEWARVVEAIANGCVVATETSVGIEPLEPGVHMVMSPLEHLAEAAIALAFDEPRRAAMADAAHQLLVERLDQGRLAVDVLESMANTPRRTPTHRRGATVPGSGALRRVARAAGRRFAAPPTPAPGVWTSTERALMEEEARTLKSALLEQQAGIRSIERALAAARHGDADHVDITTTPTYAEAAPTVSVVVPLYQQGHYLREAVESVVAAGGGSAAPRTDLVIVDDHSTDDSLQVALQLVDEMPWFPIAVVARAANGGLPVARNTGFRFSRGRYIFALDADNLLYPAGLRRLVDHLDTAPADVVAAYGLLERFDEHGSVGLTSHLPWDVDLLVHGAFIDAMAMFRREGWEALGGYAQHPGIYGWEDYDLWLCAAENGVRASLVGAIIGRYREQGGSMRKLSDIDMAANFVTLRERHPRLPWPS